MRGTDRIVADLDHREFNLGQRRMLADFLGKSFNQVPARLRLRVYARLTFAREPDTNILEHHSLLIDSPSTFVRRGSFLLWPTIELSASAGADEVTLLLSLPSTSSR